MNPQNAILRLTRNKQVGWCDHRVDIGLISVALITSALCCFFIERLPVHDGLGWDGIRYAEWARDFPNEVFVKGVKPYYVQRILPSAIVGGALHILRIEPTDQAILAGFRVLAAVLMTSSAALWCGIARELRLSDRGKWLGSFALFGNYFALKYIYFAPISTDACGYALGMAMFLAYFRRNQVGLCILILAGAFCWPLCTYVGACMLVLPRPSDNGQNRQPISMWMRLAGAIALIAAMAILFPIALEMPRSWKVLSVDRPYIEPFEPVMTLSIMISLAFVFFGSFFLFGCFSWDDLFAVLSWRRMLVGVTVLVSLIGLKWLQSRLTVPGPSEDKVYGVLIFQTLMTSIKYPGVFLVTHVALYGPIVILSMRYWPATCREMACVSPAIPVCVLIGLLLGPNSQSRFVLNIFPLIVPFVVRAAERARLQSWQLVAFGLLSLVASKVWFTINTGPFQGRLHEFPDQGFFMSHGPWISASMYAAQGAAMCVIALSLLAVFRPKLSADVLESLPYVPSIPLRNSA